MTTSPPPDRVTAIYDAVDAFQREHRTVGGLQHAQIRALLAAPPVSSPPPDQTAVERSERYAVAIHDAMEADLSLVDQEPGMQALFACAAEAAMALADAEQAAVCICGHTEQQHFEDACLVCDCGDYLPPDAAHEVIARYQQAVKREPVDRATVLLWAADQIDAETRQLKANEILEPHKFRPCRDAAAQLRRLAAEAQQPEGYEATTGHLITCLAVAGGSPDPDCSCAAKTKHREVSDETRPLCACGRFWPCALADAPAVPVQPAADGWRGATELVPDREVQRLAATGLVGYQQDSGRLLHCLHHKPAPASRYVDFQEVTAEDLLEGGICVHPSCGADLLAVQPAADDTSKEA